MSQKIDKDLNRFNRKKREMIKGNLRKLIKEDSIIVKRGKDYVSIPITKLNIPHFKFGQAKGQGQGEGDGPNAGTDPGRHAHETDVSLEELAQMLGEELELPRIEPKGKDILNEEKDRYTGVRPVGPESLRLIRRTYKEALKRQLMGGEYDPNLPVVVPINRDKKYRAWKTVMVPRNNAVIIYGMDVSASMSSRHKELARQTAFWIDLWLRYNHSGLEKVYIMHDTRSWEVEEDTFYSTTTGGGTKISSYFERAKHLIDTKYRPEDWNIYLLYFSDGDNFPEDNSECDRLISALMNKVNLIGYGQIDIPSHWSRPGTTFGNFVEDAFSSQPKVVGCTIKDNEGIIAALQAFFKPEEK